MVIVVQSLLLADAKAGEDGLENFFGADFAGDFAQVVDDLTDVLAQ